MEFKGFSVAEPINRLKSGFCAVAVNVRAYMRSTISTRNPLTNAILSVGLTINNLARLNDSTPAGPAGGFTYIVSGGTSIFAGITGTLSAVVTGMSGNIVSFVPFRPNTSVQPWMYIGDNAPSPNVTVAGSFSCSGMVKVRSDGLSRKMGIREPQAAPTVTFPGGGTGFSQIYYRYVYRASETGAKSNPSPESIPGTNAQADPTESIPATSHSNFSFNATQYEFNGTQIRTGGSVAVGTTTDPVICRNFGFTIPSGVTITGIQIDLNWIGQNAGTGVLTSVALNYLGNPYGNAKFPNIQNQSFGTDTFQGGSGDTWGATLTPAIINDPTFGFQVVITTQLSGGSDRSFINSMAITVYYSTQDANITPGASADPQVDKIDIYRMGGALPNFTYVGTSPNTATAYNDLLSDLAAEDNPQLEFDNFEPFPSIDLPRKGLLTAASQVLTPTSGDTFNTRWLPGTIILVGSPEQVAYTAVRRPSSTTSWDFTNNDPTVPIIPDGTGLVWNIAEPDLAQQPLPYLFGPTDNINFVFAVGDFLRPGTMYWCKGGNFDSAPDTNQLEVTDPSEPLVNGAMSNGFGVLFSIKRSWVIEPNFFNALADATGTEGSTWSLQATAIKRGLFIPRCIAVEGGGSIFFRVDDGISISIAGGPDKSITDETLYPLFSHEGSTPVSVVRDGITIVPPDDSHPEKQQFNISNGFLYYDYFGIDSAYHTLVLQILTMGWVWDMYSTTVTTHAANEGQSVQGVLVGCADGTVRKLASSGAETVSATIVTPAMGGRGFQDCSAVVIEYQSAAAITLTLIAADEGNGSYGPAPVTLPATSDAPTKFFQWLGPNKWKWAQFKFTTTDPEAQIFMDGTLAYIASWGVDAEHHPVPMFAGAQAGGEG